MEPVCVVSTAGGCDLSELEDRTALGMTKRKSKTKWSVWELKIMQVAGLGLSFPLFPDLCLHFPWQHPAAQQAPTWPALVVHRGGLVPGGSHQWCGSLLYHALRPALREGHLPPLAPVHGGLLRGERVRHTALEGQPPPHMAAPLPLLTLTILRLQASFIHSTNTQETPPGHRAWGL